MIELPKMTFCKILPDLPKPSNLRRRVRKDGGYDMVAAYTDEEMFKYGKACAAEAREQMREECVKLFNEISKAAWAKWLVECDPHQRGVSMGANACEKVIKELK